jgi:hypothetical protein
MVTITLIVPQCIKIKRGASVPEFVDHSLDVDDSDPSAFDPAVTCSVDCQCPRVFRYLYRF